ncbi:MAG TPA: hypothetical protein VIK25_01430 [Gemmatimonadaceae bacterium]
MANPSPYRALSAARRVDVVTRAIKSSREMRSIFVQRMLKKGGGFRVATLQSWPPDKLAREIVRMNLESADDELTLLNLLYVEFEPAIQVTFLDVAGVAHEGGKLADDMPPPFAAADAVARAAQAVCDQHGDDGRHYLATIARYNGEAWPGLDAFIAGLNASS